MNKKIFASLSLAAATAVFADSYTIDKITVTNDGGYSPVVKGEFKDPASPKRYTKDAVTVLGKQSNMNVFTVVQKAPDTLTCTKHLPFRNTYANLAIARQICCLLPA